MTRLMLWFPLALALVTTLYFGFSMAGTSPLELAASI
jgi:hypothetical protein